ncbi:MAG: hypothetical protein CSA62_14160 [Planctomycetota bacterium]|nr:MAG: hypothetical protein CSA62_14160 [Planctomycetota bacterium]
MRKTLSLLLATMALAGLAYLVLFPPTPQAGEAKDLGSALPLASGTAVAASAGQGGQAIEASAQRRSQRVAIERPSETAVLRGSVRLAKGGQPVAGVEVRALSRHPAFAEIELRFREILTKGFWVRQEMPEVEVLATTISKADGSFELEGLPPGRVFLDARSASYYSKSYPAARLAGGDAEGGVELLLSPGSQVVGTVSGPDGQPVAGARVILRPDVSSFLEQITKRSYRWFEVSSDAEGNYAFPGVPPGQDYAILAAGPGMAPAEARDVDLAPGQRVTRHLRGARGAKIVGTVRYASGAPARGAIAGFVYLDLSRILFTAGKGNLVETDAEGRFVLENVGPGQVAVTSMVDGMGLAEPQRLFISEGGVFETELVLGEGYALEGRVVDEQERPLAGASVTVRSFERPMGLDLSVITQLRPIKVTSNADGKFVVQGLSASRLFVTAEKSGYLEARESFRHREGQKDELVLKMGKGRFLSGRVVDQEGKAITRFRVRHRPENDGRRRRFGAPRWARPQRHPNPYTKRAPWSQPGEEELRAADGRFRIGPLAATKWRVSVEAEGFLPSPAQSVEVKLEEDPQELSFKLDRGATVRGRVLSKAGQQPIADVQVTWRKDREPRRLGFLPIKIDAQPEDMDFMALSSAMSVRSTLTDSKGRFELTGLPRDTELRLTARHPEYAKGNVRKLKLDQNSATRELTIEMSQGGKILGFVRGLDGRPVASTTVMALSIGAGVMRSGTTDQRGYYQIDALDPGNYMVIKTKADSFSSRLLQEIMGNLRFKSTSVKEGRESRVDIEDRSVDGVDLVGTVSEGGKPVPRAIITLLGQDKGGPFGVGVRSGTADEAGRFSIASVPPGKYLARLTRFTRSRPVPASLSLQVPKGVSRHRVKLVFPSAEISGVVVGPKGEVVKGVRVRAIADDDRPTPGGLLGAMSELGGRERGRSNAEGRFHIRRLSPGRYRLRAEARGKAADHYGSAELGNISIAEGQQLDGVRMVLPEAAVLSGVVVDGRGQAVVGAVVRVIRDKGERKAIDVAEASSRRAELRSMVQQMRASARSDAKGRFRLRGIALGSWNLEVEKSGLSTTRVEGVVLGRNSPEQRIVMLRGARVQVRVRDIDGSMVALGRVRVLNSKGQEVGKRKSLASVLGTLFRKKNEKDEAWMDFGTLAPDTYTLEVTQKKDGKTTLHKTQRVLREGEDAKWDLSLKELLQKD